ncbi:hypothetical protein ACIQXV_17205 [Neobacillus sp. NPDC097160]|uniref:hypothetical protein n=1 Tax=Neobacillus sp. NPDC097160 TaxID=3364298 RepID=UPI00381FBE82
MVFDDIKELLRDDLTGITLAREYIAQYVYQKKDSLPFEYKGEVIEICDYCVAPGRAEKKNMEFRGQTPTLLKFCR